MLAVARTSADLADLASNDPEHVVPISVDCTDEAAVAAALSACPIDHAVVYAPALSAASWSAVRAMPKSMSVRVLTSAAARPANGPDEPIDLSAYDEAPPWQVLLLGWTGAPPRWHTPAEISAAALAVLSGGHSSTLGVVRPWTERPA